MTNAAATQINEALTTWQSMSRIQSPAYFAASMMSDAQEALCRGLREHASVSLNAVVYVLENDGRTEWADTVRGLLADLGYGLDEGDGFGAPVHSVYYGTDVDGHNVYGLESRVTDGLNAIKREIFRGIENGSIR